MNYTIDIEFVNNREKAGKLTLSNSDGTVLLSKVPVAIPLDAQDNVYATGLQKIKLTLADVTSEDGRRMDTYRLEQIQKSGADKHIANKDKEAVFLCDNSGNKNLQGDNSLFVLRPEHYQVLEKVCDGFNRVELHATKVGFLWMPEKVKTSTSSPKALISSLYDMVAFFKEQEASATDTTTSTQKTGRANWNPQQSSLDFSNLMKDDKKAPAQSSTPKTTEKVFVPTSVAAASDRTQKSMMDRNSRIHSFNNGPGSDSDLDMFDVYFMYNYPSLAYMYRPNSLMAWMITMNSYREPLTQSYVDDTINQLPGFENVGKTELEYTEKGYSIDMYDKETGSHTGTLEFEQDNNCYRVVSPSGDNTYLEQDDDGHWKGCTSVGNKETTYDFVQTQQGFSGNWYGDQNDGNQVSAGFEVNNNDFSVNSSPEVINWDKYSYEPYQPEPISVDSVPYDNNPAPSYDNSYDNNAGNVKSYEPAPVFEQDYQNNNEYKEEYIPPPPPPPPPEYDSGWTNTSDNYSRFGM